MTTTMTLPHQLERTVVIQAPPETVFRYFTDSARWARWWGKGSTIDAKPGGKFLIQYPEGTQAAGEVVSIEPPRRIVITYGYVAGQPIPAGSSRVTIDVAPIPRGSRVRLVHEFADPGVRDEHVQGWRYQLSVFANVVSDEVLEGAAGAIDAWFDAWAEPDPERRTTLLNGSASAEVRFQDRYSNLEGVRDVLAHITAAQRFMPGVRVRRAGDVRQCQGTVLCDWTATGGDGKPMGSGSNVFVFGPTGRIEWVTGFWNAAGR